VFTDGPFELAQVALAHLGARRRVDLVEGGKGSRERLVAQLGERVDVALDEGDLSRIASAGNA
jgi:hypothetical protein